MTNRQTFLPYEEITENCSFFIRPNGLERRKCSLTTKYESLPDIPISFILNELSQTQNLVDEIDEILEDNGYSASLINLSRSAKRYKNCLTALLDNFAVHEHLEELERNPYLVERAIIESWKRQRLESSHY